MTPLFYVHASCILLFGWGQLLSAVSDEVSALGLLSAYIQLMNVRQNDRDMHTNQYLISPCFVCFLLVWLLEK